MLLNIFYWQWIIFYELKDARCYTFKFFGRNDKCFLIDTIIANTAIVCNRGVKIIAN